MPPHGGSTDRPSRGNFLFQKCSCAIRRGELGSRADNPLHSPTVRFTVLGPVRAWRDDAELELGPPKQRALLALLLTQAGQPVAVHAILDVLWGQDPPDSAVNVVHRHIGALRRMLEPNLTTRAASRRLIRGSGGYRIDLETDALDLLRFRALRDEARVHAEEGSPGKATEVLIEALGLWRGPTASGLAPQVRAHPVFTAVDREHLIVVKEAAQTALDAGPGLTERILVTLRAAAAHHPLDEVLQARLIVVLAATGHQAEALGVYQAVRNRLADELGLDPGPELRAAQQQVLRQTVPVGTLAPGHPVSRPEGNSPDTTDQANTADRPATKRGREIPPRTSPTTLRTRPRTLPRRRPPSCRPTCRPSPADARSWPGPTHCSRRMVIPRDRW